MIAIKGKIEACCDEEIKPIFMMQKTVHKLKSKAFLDPLRERDDGVEFSFWLPEKSSNAKSPRNIDKYWLSANP